MGATVAGAGTTDCMTQCLAKEARGFSMDIAFHKHSLGLPELRLLHSHVRVPLSLTP